MLVAPEGVSWAPDGGVRAMQVDVPVDTTLSVADAAGRGASSAGGGLSLRWALAFALVGGLLLNLMPCVFPVLSVKILGFAEEAGGEARTMRRHGWLFGAGVLVSMWVLAGGLLVVTGFYQWTPLKEACLTGCRTPMGFLVAEWRPGHRGALVMGLRHGWTCALCCWATMALMFVLGVMNLLWMAALTVFCLIEKVAPAGDRVGHLAGIGFIGWGGWLVLRALL